MTDRPRYGVRKSAAIPNSETLFKILPKGCDLRVQRGPGSHGDLMFENAYDKEVYAVIGPEGMDQKVLDQLMESLLGARNVEWMKEQAERDNETQAQEPEAR